MSEVTLYAPSSETDPRAATDRDLLLILVLRVQVCTGAGQTRP